MNAMKTEYICAFNAAIGKANVDVVTLIDLIHMLDRWQRNEGANLPKSTSILR